MRVVICDDHRLFAESLAMAVACAGHEIVAVASEPLGAVEAVERTGADICVMDLDFDGGGHLAGVRAVSSLRAAQPGLRIIVLSGCLDTLVVRDLASAGASAWVDKGGPVTEVLELLSGVRDEPSVRRAPDRWAADPLARFLTRRERDVLEALVRGETTAQVAHRLGVSKATVSTHVQSVLSKLNVHSRVEAVAFAVSRMLIVPVQQARSA